MAISELESDSAFDCDSAIGVTPGLMGQIVYKPKAL